MAKHSTPRRRSGKHWVGTLLTAGAVVACMGLLLRFLPVGTIPTGGDEPSDSAVSSTDSRRRQGCRSEKAAAMTGMPL